jgi:glycosyltransferase involved in cell wall biosynthesis
VKKVLFIASHRPGRAPGQRYRFEMYFDALREAGMEPELSYLLDAKDDAVMYKSGHYLEKAMIALRSYRKRLKDLKRIHEFDLVVIFREALMTRSLFFEQRLLKTGIPVIYDFDDAIWIRDVSVANKRIAWLKNPDKIRKILPGCTLVTAGNLYLSKFAAQYNNKVQIVPSTIDESFHFPLKREQKPYVTVGWSGSMTTLPHFERVVPVLKKLKAKHGDKLRLLTIGARCGVDGLDIDYAEWSAERENELLNQIDIGLMPLPDTEWAKGKCGMKALLYMATGTPPVASPVGVNADIIMPGRNGLHASTDGEWFEAIDRLITDTALREQLGNQALKDVRLHYSKSAWKARLVEIYQHAIEWH